jgi:hypothetical protein
MTENIFKIYTNKRFVKLINSDLLLISKQHSSASSEFRLEAGLLAAFTLLYLWLYISLILPSVNKDTSSQINVDSPSADLGN